MGDRLRKLGNKVKSLGKKTKNYMDEKIKSCVDIMSSAQNRLTLGIAAVGLGVGLGAGLVGLGSVLIASAHIAIPN